jgi:uncharacterized protein YjbJ (UPF0337 family)
MDEDRIKGTATNIGGQVKDAVGGAMGDSRTQAEGKADQVSGQLQSAYGSAKDSAQEVAGTLGTQLDSFLKERPMAALFSAVGVGYALALLLRRR